MNQEEFKQKIKDIVDSNPIGTLSTISGNKPHSRYMSFQREDITLFTATSKQTHKVEEIQENPNVHVLLGYEDWNDPYIELQGTVTVRDDKELKEDFWHDMMKNWFSGPEDPNYIILEIKPSVYRLMNTKEREPVEMEL
ncbi:pyridoxamine 5'-phosphate oxidase family protein [Fictibacillus sp. KIGAM418]|uniref:Pyridoxamine 5'-phosphate oxidase family protein n=1 Tax=Fictibacillus marinisediminis TaxID=2878389 RepID=A0A9X1XAC6_9BACL|nr:pyridoxamine 5'-phosphate oxidase family protein [Fictibacillus marinisediminis]MCK6255728.1 pyridoxamine 5'-phosphate oxidase family protein [Fictibacillus marinisediminis]